MAPTALGESTRYISPGETRIYWVPVIVDIAAPTRAELDAVEARDLTGEVAEGAGWEVTSNEVATPDLGSKFDKKIGGKTNADGSSLTFYMSREAAGAEVLTLMSRDSEGHIVRLHGGDTAGYPMDVFPVRVLASPKVVDAGGGAAEQVRVQYSVTGEPAENVPVPAAGP